MAAVFYLSNRSVLAGQAAEVDIHCKRVLFHHGKERSLDYLDAGAGAQVSGFDAVDPAQQFPRAIVSVGDLREVVAGLDDVNAAIEIIGKPPGAEDDDLADLAE